MNTWNWKPDPASPLPVYRQIETYIQQKITRGEWTPGMRLPSQRQLAQSLGVNRSTLVTALENLSALGLIEGNKGGGTMIKRFGSWEKLASEAARNWQDYVEEGIHYPNLPAVQAINRLEFQPGLIRLGTGELAPELLPDRQISSILVSIAERGLSLNYEEPQGSLELRQAVSQELERSGIHASPASILIVSGSLQALQLISIGLLSRGSSILVERPSYMYSINAFPSAGMKMAGLPMDEDGLQVQQLEQHIRKHNAAFLYTIPSFHNPTGVVMSDQRRQALLETAKLAGLPILEDGAYSDLWIDEQPPLPLKARDQEGRVLYVGTLSKSVSPGMRIGWIVGSEPVIQRLADIKMQTDYGSSAFSQQVAARWLLDGYHAEHIAHIQQELRVRRDYTLVLLQRYLSGAADWTAPAGGFYIWLSLREAPTPQKLFQQALDAGVLLNVGQIYDRLDHRHIRLSYAYASLEELEKGIIALARILE